MRDLSPIVHAMPGIVEVAVTQISECSAVNLQLIRHNPAWPNALVSEERSHEFQHPQTNRLVANVASSLREKILNIGLPPEKWSMLRVRASQD